MHDCIEQLDTWVRAVSAFFPIGYRCTNTVVFIVKCLDGTIVKLNQNIVISGAECVDGFPASYIGSLVTTSDSFC